MPTARWWWRRCWKGRAEAGRRWAGRPSHRRCGNGRSSMAALSASSCEAWEPLVTGAESASLWTATFLVYMHFHAIIHSFIHYIFKVGGASHDHWTSRLNASLVMMACEAYTSILENLCQNSSIRATRIMNNYSSADVRIICCTLACLHQHCSCAGGLYSDQRFSLADGPAVSLSHLLVSLLGCGEAFLH